MEKDKNLQKLNNNIFNKVYKFFRSLFYSKNAKTISVDLKNNIQTSKNENAFRTNIKINESTNRLILLKQKFDNRIIDVKDISMNEKIELLKMYKQEMMVKNKKFT